MSTKNLDLNLLRIFCAVIETGSMTEAAHSLELNQSAVSNAMQKLRCNLNTELFIRQKRGVKPTSAAQALYNNVSVDLTRIANAVTGLNAFDPQQSKRAFSVSCPEFCSSLLLPKLSVNDNPDLKIILCGQPDDSETLIQKIMEREQDLFIDVLVPDHHSIESELLAVDRSCVIASRSHPRLQGKQAISLQQF